MNGNSGNKSKPSISSIQSLSKILLPLFASLLAYSIFQCLQAINNIDGVSSKIEELSAPILALDRRFENLDVLKEISERSHERTNQREGIDAKKTPTITPYSLEQWNIKLMAIRMNLAEDLGTLNQFNIKTYPYLYRPADGLKNLLIAEDSMWLSLQQFLEKQASENSSQDKREQFFQNYMNKNRVVLQTILAYEGTIHEMMEMMLEFESIAKAKYNKLSVDIRAHNRSLHIFGFLSVTSLLLGFCALWGVLGMPKRQKDTSSIYVPR